MARILCINAALDRMAVELDVLLLELQGFTGRNLELLRD